MFQLLLHPLNYQHPMQNLIRKLGLSSRTTSPLTRAQFSQRTRRKYSQDHCGTKFRGSRSLKPLPSTPSQTHAVKAVVNAWENPNMPTHQVTEPILECMFHPDFQNPNSHIQREMVWLIQHASWEVVDLTPSSLITCKNGSVVIPLDRTASFSV